MKIAICEDEKIIAERLGDTVREFFEGIAVDCDTYIFLSAAEFLKSREMYDLLFLDCCLPDMNGIELAKRLRDDGIDAEIIFVTSYPEYVYESFEVSPFRYILKSENDDEVVKALKSFAAKRIVKRDITIAGVRESKTISLDDIVYIESCGKYSIVRLFDNRYYKSTKSISEYDEEINREYNGFCRTHRSFMVNMKYIKKVEQSLIIFENGENAVISRRRMPYFNKKYLDYLKRIAK